MSNLDRFIEAQDGVYEVAYNEIKNGKKRNHYMWFIFPQLKGLGMSYMSNYYGIDGISEAKEYLNHGILGKRLKEITKVLLSVENKSSEEIFGSIDSIKLKSSMTLFNMVSDDSIFIDVINKYFNGEKDNLTDSLLKSQINY